MKQQAHVMLLADQNDEDRLFQVQAIFWCGLHADMLLFQQYGVQPRDDEKKEGFLENIAKSANICRFEASLSSYLYA